MSVADFNAFRKGKIEILDQKMINLMYQFVDANLETQKKIQSKMHEYAVQMKKLKG